MCGTARIAPVDSAIAISSAAVAESLVSGFSQTTEMPFSRNVFAIS